MDEAEILVEISDNSETLKNPIVIDFDYSGSKGSSILSGFFSGCRRYFFIHVSYDPDFFSGVKIKIGRTF